MSFRSSRTPRYLRSIFTGSMSTPLSWTLGCGWMPRYLENKTQVLFSGFSLNPFPFAHFENLFTPRCIWRSQTDFRSFRADLYIIYVYRAKKSEGGSALPSVFMFIINSVELRTPPSGTPFSWTHLSDSAVPTLTLNVRSDKWLSLALSMNLDILQALRRRVVSCLL